MEWREGIFREDNANEKTANAEDEVPTRREMLLRIELLFTKE